MFGLKGRQDAFRLLLPKEFIMPEVEEKYSEILRNKNNSPPKRPIKRPNCSTTTVI